MKKTRLNHAKVNTLLSDRELDFNLPGGIEQTPVRVNYDGQLGLSDFNRFYVTNAVKAYLGMHNEFDPEEKMSKNKLNEVVLDTLKHYDLLIEVDPFYDLFLKSVEARSVLQENYYSDNGVILSAAESAGDTKNLLDVAIIKHKEKSVNKQEELIAKIKNDLLSVCDNEGISVEYLIKELKLRK